MARNLPANRRACCNNSVLMNTLNRFPLRRSAALKHWLQPQILHPILPVPLWLGGEDAERPTKGVPAGKPAPEKVIERQTDDDMAEDRQAPPAPLPPRTKPHPQA